MLAYFFIIVSRKRLTKQRKRYENILDDIMTAAEAAEKWGKAPITVQQACSGYAKSKPRFLPTEAKKIGVTKKR